MTAAVLAAGIAIADNAIVSSDIVGYQTKELASGTYTMLNVPFQHVNNDGKGLMLNSDITVANVTGNADNFNNADQIWVWVPADEAYTKFFYYDDGNEAGWSVTTGGQEYFEELTDWENGLPEGSAIFYKAKAPSGKALTGSGAIERQDEVELDLVSGTYTMIGNPYPVALQLNTDQFTAENVTGNADNFNDADQIWVWVPADEAYTKFFYYDDGNEAGWSITTGGQEYIEELEDWANGIPSGTAMYYKAKTGAGKKAVFGKTF